MKNLLSVLAIAAVFTACKDNTKFTIEGKFENPGTEKKVFLYGMANNNMELVDSTTLSEKGEFKFSRVSPEADFYRVNIGLNEYILIAKNGDVVKLDADLNDKSHKYALKGSDDNKKLLEFSELRAGGMKAIDSLGAEFERRVSETPDKRNEIFNELTPVYQKAQTELDSKIVKFALENNKSLASFYAISIVNPRGNEEAMVKYAETVDPELKKNKAVADFVDKVVKLKSVQVGQTAPDFTINDFNGKPISLKDFKGKYVLLDFWASWCAPCRQENPNVVKAYNKFKDKNFTILGISLDKDKAAWANAIKQDGLTWTHASELSDFDGKTVRLYQVDAIPSSFLLDPQGKIVARNLRGEELDAFLSKTL